jgi:hypothetical protein
MPCFRRASLLDNCGLRDWLNFIILIFAHNSVSSLAFIPGATVDMVGYARSNYCADHIELRHVTSPVTFLKKFPNSIASTTST